jgi:hypothetical protein
MQRLGAVWALADLDDGGGAAEVVLVPGSHRLDLEAPEAVLTGEDDLAWLGEPVHHRPVLRAGDLLLYSPALLHAIHGGTQSALAGCIYRSGSAAPIAERAADTVQWEGTLSPELRSILLVDQHEQPAEAPQPLQALPTTVLTDRDGRQTWLGSAAEARDDHPRVLAPVAHGAAAGGVEPSEAFHWDLHGYLILRQVMPPALLRAANAAIDAQGGQIAAQRERSRRAAEQAAAERTHPHVTVAPAWPPGRALWEDGTPHSEAFDGYPRMQV